MSFLQLSMITLAISLGAMLLMWLISLALGNASVVDPYWGSGFVLIAWATAALTGNSARTWLLLAVVTLWGLRLSAYLSWRNWGEGEDRRYRAMREKHGQKFWWVSLFTVFGIQGVIMWVVSLPVQAGMWLSADSGLNAWDALGVAVWAVGFFFESVGDWQMARFKAQADSVGKVMDRGLWRYTRHPNYFGDFCVWWGHYLIAVAAGGWWTAPSPVLMSLLLLKVSGVTLLEKDISDRRPAYRAYIERTNAFFPGPPK